MGFNAFLKKFKIYQQQPIVDYISSGHTHLVKNYTNKTRLIKKWH